MGYLDGIKSAPESTIRGFDGTKTPNPAFSTWSKMDQMLLSLLFSSLTEEAMSDVVGLSTAHEGWKTLEASFAHQSKTCEIQLKDEL